MQIGEACAIAMVDHEESSCNPESTCTTNWKAIIDEIKDAEGSAVDLLENMKKYPRASTTRS
jgi:hypothetical protein